MEQGRERTVAITSCGNRIEAELKRSALDDAGIMASVASDDAGGLHPEMSVAYCGAYRIVVRESEADDSREIIAALDRGDHAFIDNEDDWPPAATRSSLLPTLLLLGFVAAFVAVRLAGLHLW